VLVDERELGSAVLVDVAPGISLVGFVTSEHVPFAAEGAEEEPSIAVFLPMSYQIGGYTVCLPASRVRRLELSNEAAMRWVLTAGAGTRPPGEGR
jgi:uncharacterized membrane protein